MNILDGSYQATPLRVDILGGEKPKMGGLELEVVDSSPTRVVFFLSFPHLHTSPLPFLLLLCSLSPVHTTNGLYLSPVTLVPSILLRPH